MVVIIPQRMKKNCNEVPGMASLQSESGRKSKSHKFILTTVLLESAEQEEWPKKYFIDQIFTKELRYLLIP